MLRFTTTPTPSPERETAASSRKRQSPAGQTTESVHTKRLSPARGGESTAEISPVRAQLASEIEGMHVSSPKRRLFKEQDELADLKIASDKIVQVMQEYHQAHGKLTSLRGAKKDTKSAGTTFATDKAQLIQALNAKEAELSTAVLYTILDIPSNRINTFFAGLQRHMHTLVQCCFNKYTFRQAMAIVQEHAQELSTKHAAELYRIPNFKNAFDQLNLENNLFELGIPNTRVCSLEPSAMRTRIIFTTKNDSEIGFDYLKTWVRSHSTNYAAADAVAKMQVAGIKAIIQDLQENSRTPLDLTALEVAWYHVMNTGRHADMQYVFVNQLSGLVTALEKTSQNSTLVINGHGGANELCLGDEKLRGSNKLQKFAKDIGSMLNEKITHVVLAVCSTGILRKDVVTVPPPCMQPMHSKYSESNFTANPHLRFKNRLKFFMNPMDPAIFEKVLAISTTPMAALLATAVLNRENQNTTLGSAFTFCPTSLIPDLYSGCMGIPLAYGANKRRWPDMVASWEEDERGYALEQIAYKGITIYNNPANDKALAVQRTTTKWKHRGL